MTAPDKPRPWDGGKTDRNCWTCAEDHVDAMGHTCEPVDDEDDSSAGRWALEHTNTTVPGDHADGMPDKITAPCPAWKPKTTCGALAPTTGPRFGAGGRKR